MKILGTELIDDKKQWVFVELVVDGQTIKYSTVQPWNTDAPILEGDKLLDWCESQADRYEMEILKDKYEPVEGDVEEGEPTAKEKFLNIRDKISFDAMKDKGELVEKANFTTDRIPARVVLKTEIDSAKTITDIKTILKKMI